MKLLYISAGNDTDFLKHFPYVDTFILVDNLQSKNIIKYSLTNTKQNVEYYTHHMDCIHTLPIEDTDIIYIKEDHIPHYSLFYLFNKPIHIVFSKKTSLENYNNSTIIDKLHNNEMEQYIHTFSYIDKNDILIHTYSWNDCYQLWLRETL